MLARTYCIYFTLSLILDFGFMKFQFSHYLLFSLPFCTEHDVCRVYLTSPTYDGSVGSFGAGQPSGAPLLANSDHLETKSCVACEPAPVPKYAIKAFELLNKSTAAQVLSYFCLLLKLLFSS